MPAAAGWPTQGGKGEMNLSIGTILAADPTLLAQAQPNSILANPIWLMVIMIPIFYFLMIRPAQTRQKKVNEMLRNLKNGDKVITNGGIFGTIVGLEDDAVQLRIAEQVKIKVSRSAIAGLQPEGKES